MGRLWASVALGGVCLASAPARADEVLRIRAVEADTRPRFSVGRLLRDVAFGVTWDRARLPLNVSLRGNEQSPSSVRLTLSRRNFSGVTLRLRF
jgi:hypothetical protein